MAKRALLSKAEAWLYAAYLQFVALISEADTQAQQRSERVTQRYVTPYVGQSAAADVFRQVIYAGLMLVMAFVVLAYFKDLVPRPDGDNGTINDTIGEIEDVLRMGILVILVMMLGAVFAYLYFFRQPGGGGGRR